MNDQIVEETYHDYNAHERAKRKSGYRKMLLFTIISCTAILSTIFVLRATINKSKYEIPTIAANTELLIDTNLNDSEKTILTLLLGAVGMPDHLKKEENNYSLYIDSLHAYFCRTNIHISPQTAEYAEKEINNLYKIISNEETSDLNEMSVDGREVAIHLSERIYNLFELKVIFGSDNNIESIMDVANHIIYERQVEIAKTGLNVLAVAIIMFGSVVLFLICYVISRKYQLFKKDVKYDGFESERFA